MRPGSAVPDRALQALGSEESINSFRVNSAPSGSTRARAAFFAEYPEAGQAPWAESGDALPCTARLPGSLPRSSASSPLLSTTHLRGPPSAAAERR